MTVLGSPVLASPGPVVRLRQLLDIIFTLIGYPKFVEVYGLGPAVLICFGASIIAIVGGWKLILYCSTQIHRQLTGHEPDHYGSSSEPVNQEPSMEERTTDTTSSRSSAQTFHSTAPAMDSILVEHQANIVSAASIPGGGLAEDSPDDGPSVIDEGSEDSVVATAQLTIESAMESFQSEPEDGESEQKVGEGEATDDQTPMTFLNEKIAKFTGDGPEDTQSTGLDEDTVDELSIEDLEEESGDETIESADSPLAERQTEGASSLLSLIPRVGEGNSGDTAEEEYWALASQRLTDRGEAVTEEKVTEEVAQIKREAGVVENGDKNLKTIDTWSEEDKVSVAPEAVDPSMNKYTRTGSDGRTRHCRVFQVVQWPTENQPGWLDKLFASGIDVEGAQVRVTLHIEPEDTSHILPKLTRAQAEVAGDQMRSNNADFQALGKQLEERQIATHFQKRYPMNFLLALPPLPIQSARIHQD